MLDWEGEDRFSFEDSERFEEDSLCSWSSEPESLCNNWRGWKRPTLGSLAFGSAKKTTDEGSKVPTLGELTARCVAAHIPFELVEHVFPPVPEQLQLAIAFWSFPDNEEDIRLYSCLANGSAEEFQRGEHLYRNKAVKEPLQIGFHLSASVCPPPSLSQSRGLYNVAVTFDRRRITSCNCTCVSVAYWCSHVVAVCLHRIHMPTAVCLRAPVSESLSRLGRDQLQKFAQYLISELPQQILPTAQRLLDQLLSPQSSAINTVCGAPDPTAGASANEQTSWYLDDKTLHDNIKKILIKFCVPAPIVFSDVNYLSTTAPPAASEWISLLRPLRGREPEGMWNLLSIVREMFKRTDRNAIPLLEIITKECMACEQILVWWVNTKVALLAGGHVGKHAVNGNSHASQHACASLCEEIVALWRLAALNPGLSPEERLSLRQQFKEWHLKIVEKVTKTRLGAISAGTPGSAANKNALSLRTDVELFTGFKPAAEASLLDWTDYVIPGVTYSDGVSRLYFCPFTCFTTSGDAKGDGVTQVNSSLAVLNCELTTHHTHHHNPHLHSHHPGGLPKRRLAGMVEFSYQDRRLLARRDFPALGPAPAPRRDGNRSSVSSEGFCENDADADADADIALVPTPPARDSDSQEGGGSDSASSSGASASRAPPAAKTSAVAHGGAAIAYPGPAAMFDIAGCFSPDLPGTSKQPGKIKNSDADSDVSCVGTPGSRRPSKDGSTTSSDSQRSADEYNVYFYDPKAVVGDSGQHPPAKKPDAGLDCGDVFAALQPSADPWDVLFARAEGLHAHGHGREACTLGVRLAQELLANPPDLALDMPQQPIKGKKKKLNSASHQLSCLASATLARCAFLCTLLAESLEHFQLAFRVGLFGLEMARPPASTKPLEVKLANQECELVSLVKRIPLGNWEMATIRDRAEQLKAGAMRSRGEALLPIMLASFIFDALSATGLGQRDARTQLSSPGFRLATDEILGFEAAVAALGLKANVSEADHPLLCEGTRRQRGDLAISLLVHYKDDANKVARIMDKLLDREVHQLIKSPIVGAYYASHGAAKSQMAGRKKPEQSAAATATASAASPDAMADKPAAGGGNVGGGQGSGAGDFEPHMVSMVMNNPPPPPQVTTTRTTKEARFKNKRVYPSIPNQPSEAGAHFMFELAKTVLAKAGGNSSTSLFTQASTSQNHHGPHRALHICAFQIGLYALGLHNCVSSNWLSRTYSSHVSWITGQAMEIGAPAISFLIDTWEGHLTPPEAVSIADRASRGCDPNIVRAAAELALSCLPHSHALNPNEIQRAILQCKEQSDLMLEHSCLTVENAAKGGGVYPEVLFQVAKYWYELFARSAPGGMDQLMDNEGCHDDNNSMITLVDGGPVMEMGPPLATGPPSTVVMATTPPPHYQGHPAITTLAMSHVPYTTLPYSVVGLHPHRLVAHPPPPHSLHMFLAAAPPAFQYPPHSANAAAYGGVGVGGVPHPGVGVGGGMPPMQYLTLAPARVNAGHPGYHMQPQPAMPGQLTVMQGGAQQQMVQQPPGMVQQQQMNAAAAAMQGQPPRQQAQVHRQTHPYSTGQWRYLLAAYRVGMLALETLARRVHDDRPQAKYARNPPYGEDVKWLLRVAKKLGTQYLHQFCVCAVNSIVSPFVLHDVALEAAHFLSRNNPALIMQHLRSALTPLVQKCQQMYIQCMHQKLYHLTAGDYEDFVNIVLSARAAFQITPDGNQQFKEWLQSIRRSKSCKKDLWTHINDALQASSQ